MRPSWEPSFSGYLAVHVVDPVAGDFHDQLRVVAAGQGKDRVLDLEDVHGPLGMLWMEAMDGDDLLDAGRISHRFDRRSVRPAVTSSRRRGRLG